MGWKNVDSRTSKCMHVRTYTKVLLWQFCQAQQELVEKYEFKPVVSTVLAAASSEYTLQLGSSWVTAISSAPHLISASSHSK